MSPSQPDVSIIVSASAPTFPSISCVSTRTRNSDSGNILGNKKFLSSMLAWVSWFNYAGWPAGGLARADTASHILHWARGWSRVLTLSRHPMTIPLSSLNSFIIIQSQPSEGCQPLTTADDADQGWPGSQLLTSDCDTAPGALMEWLLVTECTVAINMSWHVLINEPHYP